MTETAREALLRRSKEGNKTAEAPKKSARELLAERASGKTFGLPAEDHRIIKTRGKGYMDAEAMRKGDIVADIKNIPAGFNRGVVGLAGLTADTAQNVVDLGGAAYSAGRSLLTGEDPNELYQVPDRSQLPLTADWISSKLDSTPLGNLTQPTSDTGIGRVLYGASSGVPGGLIGGGPATPQVVSGAAGGAAGAVGQELGLDPSAQAALSMLAGAGAARAAQPRAVKQEQVARPHDAEKVSAGKPLSAEEVIRPKPFDIPDDPKVFKEIEATIPDKEAQLPQSEQIKRAQTLQKIGLDPSEDVRRSAITGNQKDAATEYQQSLLDGPAGNFMNARLAREREAVNNFSERMIDESGGSKGLDQSASHSRGNVMLEPLDLTSEHFDARTKSMYTAAHERAAGKPMNATETMKVIGDDSEFLGTVEGEALLRGVKARMKSLKMLDADGNPLPTTAKEAERLRQYLGDQWTPRTNRLIKTLKNSIDDDVFKSAGESLYKESRAMRELKANTLENPNGIAKVLDSDGPSGINRKVDVEKIPDFITKLPVDQFEHVIKTYRNVPEQFKPQAEAALGEVRAQFANRVHDAGASTKEQWNAKAVTKYLAANSKRMEMVFSPEEMDNFRALNDAAHILQKPTRYPGAAAQEHNLVRAGAMNAIRGGSMAVGGTVGSVLGPMGTAAGAGVGGALGERLAGKFSESRALKDTQKKMTKLSDVLNPEKK